MSSERPPVPAEEYTEDYFLERVGGAEFFKLYGARVLKPALAYALSRSGVEGGMTALDLGCGRGELLHHLQRRGVRALGADFAPAALALARKTSSSPVVCCDAKRLPFKDNSFDRIFFLGVLDHLHDWELEACFEEFKRTLKPGGVVLADTCANTDYHKTLSYEARKRWARRLGLSEPSAPRSDEDETLHVNEHGERQLTRFFERIRWRGEIEARPNEKYLVREMYAAELPAGFPLRMAPLWKQALFRCAFHGPWKKYLARSWFCKVSPIPGK
ncbi:MAG: class I SAM-dependent methyltransferase [Elusimicrobia bacterium]|nr:class I SAM-dependent methyltransferase [Elusimicrobiota bacterium]